MIGRLTGLIARRQPGRLLLDVGGVGYEVCVSLQTDAALPREGRVTLEICTHVRETEISLYGFVEACEKQLFERLQTVSGIGPRLALGILSGMSPLHLAVAIRDRDTRRLTVIPGVGRRTAERILTDLADKMDDLIAAAAVGEGGRLPVRIDAGVRGDVRSALVNLGYRADDVENALDQVLAIEAMSDAPLESLLRESLRVLARV
jgi:holliday junction DNA helicase RuvA